MIGFLRVFPTEKRMLLSFHHSNDASWTSLEATVYQVKKDLFCFQGVETFLK